MLLFVRLLFFNGHFEQMKVRVDERCRKGCRRRGLDLFAISCRCLVGLVGILVVVPGELELVEEDDAAVERPRREVRPVRELLNLQNRRYAA